MKHKAAKRAPPTARGRAQRPLGRSKASAPKRKLRKGEVRAFVDLPNGNGLEDVENLAEEQEGLDDTATAFITGLDPNGLTRSRAALKKEHRESKPAAERTKRKPLVSTSQRTLEHDENEEGVRLADLSEDDLAFGSGASDDDLSIMSDAERDGSMSAFDEAEGEENLSITSQSDASDWSGVAEGPKADSDLERDYESRKKRRKLSPVESSRNGLLPNRLPSGSMVPQSKAPLAPSPPPSRSRVTFDDDDETSVSDEELQIEARRGSTKRYTSDPFGPRYGRPAIKAILEMKDPKTRFSAAREEIATLSRDIIASPETGLNHLRRLVTLCPTRFVPKGSDGSSLTIDQPIRALALLSTVAVFLDVVPGYRIRPITDNERQNRVSQIVLHQREWEDGLVGLYHRYIEICQKEAQGKSPLQAIALRCLCTLLQQKTHFNYSINIMDTVAKHLSHQLWDENSRLCLDAIAAVFRNDQTGLDSLHIVQLLSKTIRSANYRVEPGLLDVFLELRLRDELGNVRASHSGADRIKGKSKRPDDKRKGPRQHISKKARKALKMRAQVRKDIAEAEVEIGYEDRQKAQTETLKLLFALYFRIIKLDTRSPLLPSTLEGLARFAHLVNVDFFADLLDNLKRLMRLQSGGSNEPDDASSGSGPLIGLRERLLCILTAFELLSGQGDALNLDLADFITELNALLIPLASSCTLESKPHSGFQVTTESEGLRRSASLASEADLLFRTLQHVLFARGQGRTVVGPHRARAFGKRLLTCALNWPAMSALRALDTVARLVAKEPILKANLGAGDDADDGDQPLAGADEGETVWWEVGELRRFHYDSRVRDAAAQLLSAQD